MGIFSLLIGALAAGEIMEVVSSSHSWLAFHRTPLSAWRFRGNGLSPGHTKSTRPRKSAVLCVGTGRASNPGDSGKVHVSHGFYVSDEDREAFGVLGKICNHGRSKVIES